MASLEVERRFLIEMPSRAALLARPGAVLYRITQTYLLSEKGVTERVRRREGKDGTVYTHTKKLRLSAASAHEEERTVTEEEYARLLLRKDPERIPIEKERITLPYATHLLEIDIYPFWQRTALLEVELPAEDAPLQLPDFLHIHREITEDGRYRNAAMARDIPPEIL